MTAPEITATGSVQRRSAPGGRARGRRSATAQRIRALCCRSAIVTAVLFAGCAQRAGSPRSPDPDPERARAALATVHVANETTYRLAVSYRIAGRTGGQVGIGHVDAGAIAEMAPVPAGEPLILVARTPTGTELTLPPRTFDIDSAWTWRIDRAARFVPPQPGSR